MPTMNDFKLGWVAMYMPCHDHEWPGKRGPFTINDYWLAGSTHMGGGLSLMATEISIGPYHKEES